MTINRVEPESPLEIELAKLLETYVGPVVIEHSPDGETPLAFGVWTVDDDGNSDDLIGTGNEMHEALEEALDVARSWARFVVDDDPDSECTLIELFAANEDWDNDQRVAVSLLKVGEHIDFDIGGGVTPVRRVS